MRESHILSTCRGRGAGLLGLVLLVSWVSSSQSSWPSIPTSSSTTSAASSHNFEFIPTTGFIEDAQCNIEDLERANDFQLYAIFQELLETNFFRHFVVDLEHKCPLHKWTSGGSKEEEEEEKDMQPDDDEPEEEEEFECSGGGLAAELEMDEDAEPLCTVQTGGDDSFAFGGGATTTSNPYESSVLQSIVEKGFSSSTQRDTFEWEDTTDMVVQEEETPCDDIEKDNLPETFWMDMCSNIHAAGNAKLVNLALNPEHNTGYNGTHIWKAIYEENCITTSDSCLEERVLYRLLSGLHTSTTISIAKKYYPPSKKKGRVDWEANPNYFMEKFQLHPEYIRNMHFSYVVLLRAIRKATTYLYNYDIQSGNVMEDQASSVLLKRLLDTAILRSCSAVFSAFDESLMFQQEDIRLQQNFKGVFHNISSILDCVQCQQCKLHGKMGMLGYGTALKILFVPEELLDLERNEVVALINTAARLSESMTEVRELTNLYWEQQQQLKTKAGSTTPSPEPSHSVSSSPSDNNNAMIVESLEMVDMAVGAIARLGKENYISLEREKELVGLALSRHPELLILGKHYRNDPQRFLALTESIGALAANEKALPDAIVVGSGLAGLAATLNILDRGGTVMVLEKEHLLGGNSNKASSGMNACCPHNDTYGDSLESFKSDTVRSAGSAADLDLINTLVGNSEKAVTWLKERANVDLSLLAQLGGHSHKRTHRPSNGMAGAEIIYQMQKAVKAFEKTSRVQIMVDTKVTELTTDDTGRVVGVRCQVGGDSSVRDLFADNIILATGGFASDRSQGSYLDQHRPELMQFPATAGGFSTGDGITLATTLGAGVRDMDKVQLHPTGWVDPSDPNNPTKILAAELMRGVGGVLLSPGEGKRFCNELGTRAYVTDKMLQFNEHYSSTGEWDVNAEVPSFHLVLSSAAAADGQKHVDLYTHKGLLTKIEGLDALAAHTGYSKSTLKGTFKKYQEAAKKGKDEFGKTSFRGLPAEDLSNETFYVGVVTPVLHYCMGGIKIDKEGNVLRDDGTAIPGLHAAGEVTGGVHGNNRLGGNSLLECTVFGTIVGQKIPIKETPSLRITSLDEEKPKEKAELPKITKEELRKHNTEDDIWVAILGKVYDFTDFAHEHPAGFDSIFDLAGMDGTGAFMAVHNEGMLEDFEEEIMGTYAS